MFLAMQVEMLRPDKHLAGRAIEKGDAGVPGHPLEFQDIFLK